MKLPVGRLDGLYLPPESAHAVRKWVDELTRRARVAEADRRAFLREFERFWVGADRELTEVAAAYRAERSAGRVAKPGHDSASGSGNRATVEEWITQSTAEQILKTGARNTRRLTAALQSVRVGGMRQVLRSDVEALALGRKHGD